MLPGSANTRCWLTNLQTQKWPHSEASVRRRMRLLIRREQGRNFRDVTWLSRSLRDALRRVKYNICIVRTFNNKLFLIDHGKALRLYYSNSTSFHHYSMVSPPVTWPLSISHAPRSKKPWFHTAYLYSRMGRTCGRRCQAMKKVWDAEPDS